MEKKRVVPVWVSVILVILLVLGMVLDIYTLAAYSELDTWIIPIRIINCISCVLALAYCLKGYSKNAAGFFKVFCTFYCVSCLIPIYYIAETYQAANIISSAILTLHLIPFACMSIFVVAKDIGKKKSYVLSGIVVACTLVNCVIGILLNMTFYFFIGTFLNVILTIVFFIMVYAKYKDKAARGTK